jgi:hypothetical protein
MFGWNRDEAVGRRLSELFIPHRYRDAHDRVLRHFLSTGEGALLNRLERRILIARTARGCPHRLASRATVQGGAAPPSRRCPRLLRRREPRVSRGERAD